jgi:glycosyltransferase involved in cell wall biosynthesis
MALQTAQLLGRLRAEGIDAQLVATNAPYRPAWMSSVTGVRALFRLIPYLGRLWRLAGKADVLHVMANSGWSWHLFAAPAVWVARLRGVPVIVNYRGGEADAFLARSARWVLPTLKRAQLLVVPSGFLRDVFGRHGFPSRVIPNVVDLSLFRPGPRAAQPVIMVSRNLEAIYGLDTALRAMALVLREIPSARLVVAGSGPQRHDLQELAESLGISRAVEFTGRLDRQVLANRLGASWVCLNSSLVDNMPNSLLEAMACCVPIVSTRVGGVPYIVDNGRTGLLVPPADAVAMGAAIVRLIQDPALAQRLTSAARASVDAYTWEAVGPQWFDAYREVSA